MKENGNFRIVVNLATHTLAAGNPVAVGDVLGRDLDYKLIGAF